jgi:GT2 family glycosyltransferase
VSGAFWVVRRSALAEVGPLDERFFLLCEEVDWCLRARAHGHQVALVRDAEVLHTGGRSFRASRKAAYYYGRNMFLLCRKHAGTNRWWRAWARTILAPLATPQTWRTAIPVNALWGGLDALRGRYGPRPVRP